MDKVKTFDEKIEGIEKEIFDAKRRLAELRKERPEELVEDFELVDGNGTKVRLSSLFGSQDTLMLIHNMGPGCAYCTLWADAINGILAHLENRMSVVLESPVSPEEQRAFALDRGWKFRLVSSSDSSIRQMLGYADAEGNPWPGVSTFHKTQNGSICRYAHADFGPGDLYCNLWDFFDLIPRSWTGQGEDEGIDYYYSPTK